MQVLIEVPDEKAQFVLELLKNLSFVEIKDEKRTSYLEPLSTQTQRTLSPKTASLLGAFPALNSSEFDLGRTEAAARKHL
ncbi:hypothetical protein ACO2Q8_00210 [Larkinella sp. VNQ87]|uniref:hypothetical protein n=1 Tax=Larkinella sp. VNQ87 TaxID=3400921 RepID=UPI003BFE302F